MAGHSKWANIQHRKSAQDAKRGKLFTRLIREINVAARSGDPDPASNPRLRLAVDKALSANMSKDAVDRAIKRATGSQDGANLEEVRYEGYGPGGTAIMVECMTDNRNRTVADVRHAFSKFGGNLGTDGSVAYLFNKMGVLRYGVGLEEDAILEAALATGAQDVVSNDDGSVEVLTDPDEFMSVKEKMVAGGYKPEESEVTMRPENYTFLEGEDAQRIVKLLEMLEEHDDVQNVYCNADISDEVLENL